MTDFFLIIFSRADASNVMQVRVGSATELCGGSCAPVARRSTATSGAFVLFEVLVELVVEAFDGGFGVFHHHGLFYFADQRCRRRTGGWKPHAEQEMRSRVSAFWHIDFPTLIGQVPTQGVGLMTQLCRVSGLRGRAGVQTTCRYLSASNLKRRNSRVTL